ncbi:MAG: hypothetical protein FWC48_02305 [Actinomycetia bacterium]|nr:hypothetical protein [Actinomycetes bacterium]
MPAFEMEFEVLCPHDGMVTVGLTDIEGVKIQSDDHAELLVRCPRCGTLITVITQLPADMPAALMHVMEAISHGIDSPLAESRLNALFTQMESWTMGPDFESAAGGPDLSALRELDETEESHVGYFRSELDKLDSVDEFLQRLDED